MRAHLVSLPTLALTLLVGCPPPTDPDMDVPDPPGDLVSSDLERDSDPDVTDADVQSLTASNRDFAFALYQEVSAGEDNLLLSPHSVSVALAMTYAGAQGNTESEMAAALHFDLPEAELHPAFNKLDLELASRSDVDYDNPPQVQIVNTLFGQTGFAFETPFLDVLAVNYGAAMHLLDFEGDPDGSREEINDWVEEATHDRVVDLLPPGSITDLTRLVLANAIWFKGTWAVQFEPDDTADGTFTLLDSTEVTVPIMHGVVEDRYVDGDGYTLVELSYDGWDMAMTLIVPDAGRFAEIEQGLDRAFFDAALEQADVYEVTLSMPSFEFRSPTDLALPLRNLGMVDAFSTTDADFSGMSTEAYLYITGVFHQGFIGVDEEGTEAAAATAVVVGTDSAPPQATIDIDRPFLLAIRDRPTGEVLFLGRVTDPR